MEVKCEIVFRDLLMADKSVGRIFIISFAQTNSDFCWMKSIGEYLKTTINSF